MIETKQKKKLISWRLIILDSNIEYVFKKLSSLMQPEDWFLFSDKTHNVTLLITHVTNIEDQGLHVRSFIHKEHILVVYRMITINL